VPNALPRIFPCLHFMGVRRHQIAGAGREARHRSACPPTSLAGLNTSNTAGPGRSARSTAGYAAGCGASCASSRNDRAAPDPMVRIRYAGQMPTSTALGYSTCGELMKPLASPLEGKTINRRAGCGRPAFFGRTWPLRHPSQTDTGAWNNDDPLMVHVWTPIGSAVNPQRRPVVDRYIAAIEQGGVISTGHAAGTCERLRRAAKVDQK
jgi:hypothetical protein